MSVCSHPFLCVWRRREKGESEKPSGRKPGARIFEPVRLIRQRGAEPRFLLLGSAFAVNRFRNPPVRLGPRKNFFAKRRMRVERTALPRVLLSKQEDLKCRKNVRYFFGSPFRGAHAAPVRLGLLASRQNSFRKSP